MQSQDIRQRKRDDLRDGTAIDLVPYTTVDGIKTLPDTFLADFFGHMQADGIVHSVWGDKMPDVAHFLEFFHNPNILPVFAFIEGRPAGVAWLNNIAPNNAVAHFAILREHWGRTAMRIAGTWLDYWFSVPGTRQAYLFDVIIGVTPSVNRRALHFVDRLGFSRVGEVPYVADGDPATISYLTREDWNAKK